MHWLNPLPAETVIGAIVGAVLSTILAYNDVFNVTVGNELKDACLFIGQIITFGVIIHFFCAAFVMGVHYLAIFTFFTTLVIVANIAFLDLQGGGTVDVGRIDISFNLTNLLLSLVLSFWFIALFALTLIKKHVEKQNV